MISLELLLAQSVKVTNWLTPVWMMSVGISLGFLLVLVGVLKIYFVSKVPGLNSITEKRTPRIVSGVVLGLVYMALALVVFYYLADVSRVLTRFSEDPEGSTHLYDNLVSNFVLYLILALPFCLFLGFGVLKFSSRGSAVESIGSVREGLLYWLNYICIGAVVFAATGYLLAMNNGFGVIKFVDDPDVVLNSLGRIPYAKTETKELEVHPSGENSTGDEVPVDFYGQEVKWIEFRTDQRLEVSAVPITNVVQPTKIFNISAASENEPSLFVPRVDNLGPIPRSLVEKLYVINLGKKKANVKITYRTGPVYGEVWIIYWTAALVVIFYFSYLAFAALLPKVNAIALSTFKTEISQPLFLIVLVIGIVFVIGSVYVPYNTFGEDIKMYKDSGLTLIKVLAIFLAIWAASKSVAEEIDGRTALTVLSKPVSRRQFILGKVSGISLAVALLFIVLGLWFFIWTAYKPIYDGREMSKGIIEWAQTFGEATSVIPALFLGFLEVVIFISISVAISTRFGILPNFLMCFAIYVLGHLTPLIVQSAEAAQAFETVGFFGQLIAIVFPVLNHFDVQAAINTNRSVPMEYLGWSIIYCALYGTMSMLLALVLFEDRDLA